MIAKKFAFELIKMPAVHIITMRIYICTLLNSYSASDQLKPLSRFSTESNRICCSATSFSRPLRKNASRGLLGRTITATTAKNTVRQPSRMNRYDQLNSFLPLEEMWKTPKARRPPNADARTEAA